MAFVIKLAKHVLVVGGLVLIVHAASHSLGVSKLQSDCGTLYTVVTGDGCSAIADSAGITQAQLAALNPSLNCTTLAVGQGLCLALPCSKTYVVASGDWCAKIEGDQNITEADMLSLNPGLACGAIFAGQRLCIAPPVVDPAPPSTEPPPVIIPADPYPTVPCQNKIAITEGDTCFDLAVQYGIQLSQFTSMNGNLVCEHLQAGDIACVLPACGSIYKVQNGDWCAKIEGDFSLESGQLNTLNPGLSCDALAADQTLCVAPPDAIPPDDSTPTYAPRDVYPVFSPGDYIPQSPVASYLNANDSRKTFAADLIFQGTSSHMSTFSRADINRDGVLDIDELRTLMAVSPSAARGVTGINDAEQFAQHIMTSSDTNGDGKISQEEYLSAVGQAQQATTDASFAGAEKRELGHPQKRIIPLLILGLIGLLVIASFATMMGEMEKKSRQQAGELLDYLDITFWDREGGAPEPKCSAYMYYSSSCAALGNSWASDCSEGGEKVYDESCNGLFTDGAKACGFLGCSSLCYKINTEGCSCDALNYTAEEGYYYSDDGDSTTTESGVAACRSKCSNLTGCVGFTVTPASSDDTLTCKVLKSMTTKVQQDRAASFKLIGPPVGSSGNPICPVVPQGYAPRPLAQMQSDQLWGEWRSWSYTKSYLTSAQKRADSCPTGPPKKRSLELSALERRQQRNGNLTGFERRELTPRALDTVDLRSTYGTTVKDQGLSGACASFTTTSLVEGTIKRKYQRIGITNDLSPLWIHGCRAGSSTNLGNYFSDIYQWVGDSYIATESCMPWSFPGRPSCQDNQCAASQYGKLPYITSTKSFVLLNAYMLLGGVTDIEEIKDWLKNNGPVYMSFTVNDGFSKYVDDLHASTKETVYYDGLYPATCGYGNHAMTVVGYSHYTRDDDPCGPAPRLYWIVQNSWGSQKGRNGHVFIEVGALANTIGYEPAYGIKVNEGQQWFSTTLPVD